MPKILFIDNHDSFTYNVIQAFLVLGVEVSVCSNDTYTMTEEMQWDALVISPGPGHPRSSGVSLPLIHQYHTHRPVLGICLGHQAIAYAFGGSVGSAQSVVHGEAHWVHHNQDGLFTGVSSPFSVGRYHSLAIHTLPQDFLADAYCTDGTIMSIRHRIYPTFGLQFHPESILTPMGMRLFENFLLTIHS